MVTKQTAELAATHRYQLELTEWMRIHRSQFFTWERVRGCCAFLHVPMVKGVPLLDQNSELVVRSQTCKNGLCSRSFCKLLRLYRRAERFASLISNVEDNIGFAGTTLVKYGLTMPRSPDPIGKRYQDLLRDVRLWRGSRLFRAVPLLGGIHANEIAWSPRQELGVPSTEEPEPHPHCHGLMHLPTDDPSEVVKLMDAVGHPWLKLQGKRGPTCSATFWWEPVADTAKYVDDLLQLLHEEADVATMYRESDLLQILGYDGKGPVENDIAKLPVDRLHEAFALHVAYPRSVTAFSGWYGLASATADKDDKHEKPADDEDGELPEKTARQPAKHDRSVEDIAKSAANHMLRSLKLSTLDGGEVVWRKTDVVTICVDSSLPGTSLEAWLADEAARRAMSEVG
jgi:hypothetical protein